MARALDAGSGDAFTGRTSELRGKEKDPQPDRVGFKQAPQQADDTTTRPSGSGPTSQFDARDFWAKASTRRSTDRARAG
jgi:hypothetical protein